MPAKKKNNNKKKTRTKKLIILAVVILLLGGGSIWGYSYFFSAEEQVIPESPEPTPVEEEEEEFISPYTGLPIEEENLLKRPFAILIDNHPKARPQYGIKDASYVYEVIAEAGITRLLSIFPHKNDINYGPVRSLRPYYAHLSREHDAIMAHCGYSEQTANIIWQDDYANIDEGPYPRYYYREPTLPSPHNLFTSIENLIEGARDFDIYREVEAEPLFEFRENNPTGTVEEVEIPFSSHNHVTYKWNDSREGYERYVNEQPHRDAHYDEQILVNNIIVQYAGYRFISHVHRKYEIVGSGEGLLIKNGRAEEITWEKEDHSQQTNFYGKNGDPLKVYPGNTWIHILSPGKEAVLTEKEEENTGE